MSDNKLFHAHRFLPLMVLVRVYLFPIIHILYTLYKVSGDVFFFASPARILSIIQQSRFHCKNKHAHTCRTTAVVYYNINTIRCSSPAHTLNALCCTPMRFFFSSARKTRTSAAHCKYLTVAVFHAVIGKDITNDGISRNETSGQPTRCAFGGQEVGRLGEGNRPGNRSYTNRVI